MKGLRLSSLSALVLHFLAVAAVSTIATFSDGDCQNSYRSLQGPNGYPNGTCTKLNAQGPFSSFQVISEDPGCTVTIYAADTDPASPCSATVLEFAQQASCYNTSWVYYSIDACTSPQSISSASGTPTAHASASATATPNNTGAIVGGTVGGIGAALIIAGVGAFIFWRRRKQRPGPPQQEIMAHQLHGDERKPHELGGGQGMAELGRNDKYMPPEELPGSDFVRPDGTKVGIQPQTPMELPGNDAWINGDGNNEFAGRDRK